MIESFEKLHYHKKRIEKGEVPSTFQYEEIPENVRKSIMFTYTRIFPVQDSFGRHETFGINIMRQIRQEILEYMGQMHLYDPEMEAADDFYSSFREEDDIDLVLTYIQLLCLKAENEEFIKAVNWHLKNNGVGYKYENGQIIRIEDETFFDNVTQPLLSILSESGYEDTLSEFLKAYNELKNGQHNDAVTACTRALETILKTRLDHVGKLEDPNWTVNELLKLGFKPNVNIPDYMEDYLNNLTSVLQGSATVRNKDGAHGSTEGDNDNLDEVFVRYIINQTAASILFIAECEFNKN